MVSVVVGAGCGGEVDSIDRAPQESSPWLLTHAGGTLLEGALRAHRIEDGKVRTEHLESSATRPLSWAPSGSWMTYLVTSPRENALWQMDRPQETAIVLEGIPATAHVTWLPAR